MREAKATRSATRRMRYSVLIFLSTLLFGRNSASAFIINPFASGTYNSNPVGRHAHKEQQASISVPSFSNNSRETTHPSKSSQQHDRTSKSSSAPKRTAHELNTGSTDSSPLPDETSKKHASSMSSSSHRLPWQAGYYTSLKSQKIIQNSVPVNQRPSVDRATRVLSTFLSIPPERCNAANLVCALTLSAKVIGSETNESFRLLLQKTFRILDQLLIEKQLSARQLCNVAWAIAKHYDRDPHLLPAKTKKVAISIGARGQAEKIDLRDDDRKGPEHKLDCIIDEIAKQLTDILEDDNSAAKEGELCMASWAFGLLRRRRRPPGWSHEPQVGKISTNYQASIVSKGNDALDFVHFESWDNGATKVDEIEECSPTDTLFDRIGQTLIMPLNDQPVGNRDLRLRLCRWNELANLAWAFASHGRSCSAYSQGLMLQIAYEATRRLKQKIGSKPLSRDIAQLIWSLGTLQADNFRLADSLIEFIDAVNSDFMDATKDRPFRDWSCADIVQVALSLAHTRLDDFFLLENLYREARTRLSPGFLHSKGTDGRRMSFLPWEISILLWSQARLHLTGAQSNDYELFTKEAVKTLYDSINSNSSMESLGIGAQEQANIVWSLTVLEEYDSRESKALLNDFFRDAASACTVEGTIQLEHAHQLWQALYILDGDCPECVSSIPSWFREALRDKWLAEKSRSKTSSLRHKSISDLLRLMGVDHVNEHDEDIDVAIILKSQASWTHETDFMCDATGMKVAVEFDGPTHFARPTGSYDKVLPRTLGHTNLKYRILKRQGWTVVRVPYFEFDKIPFWASMERQRYLQRLLKTHVNIQFSKSDVSEYKTPISDRKTRFD